MVTEGSVTKTPLAVSPAETIKTAVKVSNKNKALAQKKADCEAKGGKWDEATQSCILPTPKEQPFNVPDNLKANLQPGTIEAFRNNQTGRISGAVLPDGRTFLGLSPDEVNQIAQAEQQKATLPANAQEVGTAQNALNSAIEAQQLRSQVGQFEGLPVSPTGLDVGEALTTGVVNAIPRALSLAATGAGAGLAAGAAGGTLVFPGLGTAAGAGIGAAVGAIGGFVAGISSSMISNFKSQRSDTTTAQQRVLDEGKQTMKDWATLAETDPANKAQYLTEYNKVSAQIAQAYAQMKLDTNRDLAKFETALPNLAEFEAFYAPGGERDTLDQEMRNALLSQASPEYKMLELAQRRKQLQ